MFKERKWEFLILIIFLAIILFFIFFSSSKKVSDFQPQLNQLNFKDKKCFANKNTRIEIDFSGNVVKGFIENNNLKNNFVGASHNNFLNLMVAKKIAGEEITEQEIFKIEKNKLLVPINKEIKNDGDIRMIENISELKFSENNTLLERICN